MLKLEADADCLYNDAKVHYTLVCLADSGITLKMSGKIFPDETHCIEERTYSNGKKHLRGFIHPGCAGMNGIISKDASPKDTLCLIREPMDISLKEFFGF